MDKVDIAVRILEQVADNALLGQDTRMIPLWEAQSLQHIRMSWSDYLHTCSSWSKGIGVLHLLQEGFRNMKGVDESVRKQMSQDDHKHNRRGINMVTAQLRKYSQLHIACLQHNQLACQMVRELMQKDGDTLLQKNRRSIEMCRRKPDL